MIKNIWKTLDKVSVTQKFYDDLRSLISTGKIEGKSTPQYLYRMKRYLPYFDIIDSELILTTDEPLPWDILNENKRRSYIVVNPSKKKDLLQKFYEDVRLGGLKGIRNVYYKMRARYLGITIKDIKELLSKQELVQIYTPVSHLISSPIVAKKILERWEIDLIDMSKHSYFNNNITFDNRLF